MMKQLSVFFLFLFLGLSLRAHNFDALVFSSSTPTALDYTALAALNDLSLVHSFSLSATSNPADLNAANLSTYQVLIFLNRNGNGLTATQRNDVQAFVESGKGFVAIHSACNSTTGWPWFNSLVGANTSTQTAVQNGEIIVADRVHPASKDLTQSWTISDAWFNLQSNPRSVAHVLATLKESTISGGTNGFDHPVAWCRYNNGGRVFVSVLGGNAALYSQSAFLDHLRGGIEWAAGVEVGDAGVTIDSNFGLSVLVATTQNPTSMAIAPDGRVFFTELRGNLKVYNPSNGAVTTALTKQVCNIGENGMLGVALDPKFGNGSGNDYIYVFYTDIKDLSGNPSWSLTGPAIQNISRFSVTGNTVNAASEEVLLTFTSMREGTVHTGGCINFDSEGNLVISVGDNTSYGTQYAPLDERAGNSYKDAQRTSANTNNLNGKILRIKPKAYGSPAPKYTSPNTNLFQPGGPASGTTGRPEIFVMGVRNPYRFCVDTLRNWVYWGDVGPDAFTDHPQLGPRGYDEFNLAKQAGNFGWPYISANNQPYGDHNFATGITGPLFNPNSLVNNSPNNTGAFNLPSAQPAMIWYSSGGSPFPEINGAGGAVTAIAGAVYHYRSGLPAFALPEYYNKTLFLMDWSRNKIWEVKQNEQGTIMKINPFLPTVSFQRPIEMKIGPDGSMYIIEWGTGWIDNANARIVRIRYTPAGRPPVALASANTTAGALNLTVNFTGSNSYNPDGGVLTYLWNFGNGITSTQANPSHTYTTAGVYNVTLTVTNASNMTATASLSITAGNNRPVVNIIQPLEGGFFDWGDNIGFSVVVTDVEDGSTANSTIPCSALSNQSIMGHDNHGHPSGVFQACDGFFSTGSAAGHSLDDNTTFIFMAAYTDNSAAGAGPLTGSAQHLMHPKVKQAEYFTGSNNMVDIAATADVAGRNDLIDIDHNDFISFTPMNLYNIYGITYRAAAAGPGGAIELRKGSVSGQLVATATIPTTGSNSTYTSVYVPITDPGGSDTYFFVFKNAASPANLFRLNWIQFHGGGVSLPVELSRFDVAAVGNQYVDISWETLNEINSDRFEVERVRDNLENPEMIVSVPSTGGPGRLAAYGYRDLNPLAGRSFYRLVQYDNSGDRHISNWKSVYFDPAAARGNVQFYPNPASTGLNVRLSGIVNDLSLNIITLGGASMYRKRITPDGQGIIETQLDLSGISPGMYLLQVQHGGSSSYHKLTIMK